MARVCSTDAATVEKIYNEILAQLKRQLQQRNHVRMTFKVGRLLSKNGELQWKSSQDDFGRMDGALKKNPENSRYSKSNISKAMVGSQAKKDLSVLTPSIAARSRVRSVALSADQNTFKARSFHMANPNP